MSTLLGEEMVNLKEMTEKVYIASPLRLYLQNTNQTVAAFHRKSGVRLSTLYNILSGTRPQRATVRRICSKSNGMLRMKDFGYD